MASLSRQMTIYPILTAIVVGFAVWYLTKQYYTKPK